MSGAIPLLKMSESKKLGKGASDVSIQLRTIEMLRLTLKTLN
jgi:hypothetical protein